MAHLVPALFVREQSFLTSPPHSPKKTAAGASQPTAIAELSQFANHFGGTSLCPAASDSRPAFLISDAFVQNDPDQTAKTMGNGSDGLRMPKAYDKPSIQQLEDTASGLDSRVRRLVEQTPHLPIAVG